MSVLVGVGVVTTIVTLYLGYLGKKGWQAFHKAVGITPGVLAYQDDRAPLSQSTMHWQQLNLNSKHLTNLPEHQLRQLQRIDDKVNHYQSYQKQLQPHSTHIATESQFVLHKMLYNRLPEALASHYQLTVISTSVSSNAVSHKKQAEAHEILQQVLTTIEQRLDKRLEQVEAQHLQDLRVMKRYVDSQDTVSPK